jgi:hypothetical protein
MESHFSKSFLTYYMCKTGIQISLLTYNSIFLFKYEPGTKASGYTFVQNSKNKGHIPTKEHMTSAAEQHGAAASRNAFAPWMLYSFAVVHAPLSGCAQADSRQASQSLPGINGHPFRFCCCLLGPSTREIHAAFIFPHKYDLFFRKKRSRAIRTRLRKVEEIA